MRERLLPVLQIEGCSAWNKKLTTSAVIHVMYCVNTFDHIGSFGVVILPKASLISKHNGETLYKGTVVCLAEECMDD